MYIDKSLIALCEERYGKNFDINKAIECCGIWYSLEGVRAEWEDFDATLEEVISEYYFIIEENKILFCSPEQFISDCDEWH